MKKVFIAVALSFILFISMIPTTFAVSFSDIRSDHSLLPEIDYLAQQNILNGYPDDTFKPDAPIAKQHIAVLLVRALNLPTTNVKNPGYKDVPTTHMYYKEIAAAYTAGLFSKADYFRPTSTISRGFMAKLLAQSFNLELLPLRYGSDSNFTDVPPNHGYYTDIMKITSNNIATGYTDGTFKPAQTITRAHFAAFLARGLTLKTGNYLADRNYAYYYIHADGTRTKRVFKESLSNTEQLWTETHLTTNVTETMYVVQDDFSYANGLYETDLGHYIPLPTTVRTLQSGTAEGTAGVREVIISTNGSLKIGSHTYNNLVIVERYEPYVNDTFFIYFAENLGVLATTSSKGQLMYYFEKSEAIR